MQQVDCNGPRRQTRARRAWKLAHMAACCFLCVCARTSWAQQLTLEVKDYATFPITGSADKSSNNVAGLLARINFLRDEPGGGKRFFVNDMNGPLYILDKQTKKITTYLNFNGRDGQGGLFHRFRFENGQGNGFVNFLFDPDYAHNGKFYTMHLEDPSLARLDHAGQHQFSRPEAGRL